LDFAVIDAINAALISPEKGKEMRIGLVGLEKSGKTTIFNALTGSHIETNVFASTKNEPNVAVVQVADPRVERLTGMYKPKKTAYATIECMDFGGFAAEEEKKEIFSPAELALVKNADALALVLRNFSHEMLDGILGAPDPLKDKDTILTELILSDLILAETRLERIEHFIKRGASTPDMDLEKKALLKVSEALNRNTTITSLNLSPEELKPLRGFRFLTEKPMLVILNSDEAGFGSNQDLVSGLEKDFRTVEFAGQFEMELSALDADEAREFMEEMKISASAKDRLSMLAYEVLGYITFFTVGADEVKAWTIRRGETAVDAAGAIHSDLARGFIRAECFSYDDLMSLGSEKALRDKGLFRLEGKNYLVHDGDIMSIRHSS
jgi:ribosome-binding ATPase